MLQFPVGIAIEAIDHATAKTRAITAGLVKATKPLTRFRQAFTGLGEAAGLPRLLDGFRGVGRALGEVGDAAKRAALLVGGLVTAAGLATFSLVRGFAAAGDSAQKAAQKIGIGVEALQELRYAGELANVEQEELDAALVRLARNVGLAARGQRSALKPFERLGISIHDQNGNLRTTADLLPEIADKFGRLDDEQKRVVLSQDLFGKAGANLIPLLREGSAGLKRSAEEARRFGIVLSKEDTAAGEEFMDSLTRVGAALRGVRNTIGRELLPVLQDLVNGFREWVVENLPQIREFAKRLARELPDALERARRGFMAFWEATEPVRKVLAKLYDLLGPVGTAIAALATVLVVSLVPAIASTIGALATLSAALVSTPAGWVVLALTAVAAAFAAVTSAIALLVLNWDAISERFPRLAALAEALGGAFLKSLLTPIMLAVAAVVSLLDKLEELSHLVPDWALGLAGVDVDKAPGRGAGGASSPGAGGGTPSRGQLIGGASGPGGQLQLAEAIQRFLDQGGPGKKGEATVHVDFSNLPAGTRVTTEAKPGAGADVDLRMGYAAFNP